MEASAAATMRPYQQELSIPGKEGKNTIVFAPEGGGKTRVAMDIILDHLEKRGTSKTGTCVVYLVNSSLRRNKIEDVISKHGISYAVYGGGETDDEIALKTLMTKKSVIVLTAQVLLNLLGAESPHRLSLEELSLVVFDECHRAAKGHCYNSIMRHYLKSKIEQPGIRLPQVVGLTSTLNVGPRDDMRRAEDNIRTICAHLAAESLSVVTENADDLGRYLRIYPVMEELEIPQREDDQCHKIIAEHMKVIHDKMAGIQKTSEITGKKKERLEKSLEKLPEDFGSQHYNRWIRKMKFSVQTIKNCPQKQELIYYSGYLIMYNQALIINAQARTTDALLYLKEEIKSRRESHARAVAADQQAPQQGQGTSLPQEVLVANRWLEEEYRVIEERLTAIADDERYANPMLALLKQKLQELSQDDNARGIFVVETKAAPQRLKGWMQSDRELKDLKPVVMSGDGQAFNDPSRRILITSAGQERGEMPKCTWVIRLMYSSKRIEVIRVKGDASWSYSELVPTAVLNQAAANVSQMESTSFKQAMENIQRDELKGFKKQLEKEENERDRMIKTYKLHCLRCNMFVCNSTELRVYNTNHRTSIRGGLSDLYNRKPHPKPVAYRDVVIKEKLHCGKCDHDWGNFARIMDLWMPVLKPEGFVFVYSARDHTTYKTWKQVPVNIKPLANVEKDIIREQYG